MNNHIKPREPWIGEYELFKIAVDHADFSDFEREYVLSALGGINSDRKITKPLRRLIKEGVFREEERHSFTGTKSIIVLNKDFQKWGKYSISNADLMNWYKRHRCWCSKSGIAGAGHFEGEHNDDGKCKSVHWLHQNDCTCVAFVSLTRPYEEWVKAQNPKKAKRRVHKEKGHLPTQSFR